MQKNNTLTAHSAGCTQTNDIELMTHLASETFCPMACRRLSGTLNATMAHTPLDTTRLATVASDAVHVVRNAEHISQASNNFYLVKFQLSGQSIVLHKNQQLELHTGDFVVCSSSDPYELYFHEPYSQAVLCIAQCQLNELMGSAERYAGVAMSGSEPVNAILHQFVSSLAKNINELEPETLRRIEANILDLLITCLQSSNKHFSEKKEKTPQQHLKKIKQFIALHLKDGRLSPDFIADAEGIGTRYLHMLFKSEPLSVSRYIREKRLEACGRALLDPQQRAVSATQIALECGFNDISHFHRCFKSRYGVTPGRYRDDALKEN